MQTPAQYSDRLKNRALVLLASVGCAALMAAMQTIYFIGARVERSRRFLGPIGSRLARWTIALCEFGKRNA